MLLAVIPARYASTRFPGKPLVLIQGKSMIQRVYEQALMSQSVDEVVIATDDDRIFDHARSIGANVVMTKPDHPSGTDRCAEVMAEYPQAQYVLNIQGDEPFVQPEQIDLLADTLMRVGGTGIATLAKKIHQEDILFNPNVVKVVFSADSEALYFSRHPIPFIRGAEAGLWLIHHDFYKHIGLYGFHREALTKISALAPSRLEKAESLEQLRWLENGFRIRVGITELETTGIDTPEDLEKIENLPNLK
jgi:3-deoxy-manno-octulosonate cytidylyltransferase (CMP-KDO synthetase)